MACMGSVRDVGVSGQNTFSSRTRGFTILTDGKLSYTLAHPSSSSSLEGSSSLTAKAARALPAGGFGFLFDGAFVDVCIAAASLSFLVLRFAFLAALASGLDAGFLAGFLGALSLPGAFSEAARL